MDTLLTFKSQIEKNGLVRSSPDVSIILREDTGAYGEWMLDIRALTLQPEWLNRYAEIFWERYARSYPFQVGGMETAGIALVAAIVMKSVERGTPVNGFFIRKSRKREGLMKNVEGILTNDPIILVDDLINSGNTFSKQIDILSDLKKHITRIYTLVSFREKNAYAHIVNRGIAVESLFSLSDFGIPLLTYPKKERAQNRYSIVWRFTAPHPSYHLVLQKSTPALDAASIFFGTDDGTFWSLDQTSGNVRWKFAVGSHPKGKGILSSPALFDTTVYFGAYDGNVYALDTATGKKKWISFEADWVGSSPCIAQDLGIVYIGLEFGLFRKRGGVAALDAKTGKTIWSYASMPCYTHASPLYIQKCHQVVIGSNDGAVYLFDARTGSLIWKYESNNLSDEALQSGFSDHDIKGTCAYDEKRDIILAATMDGSVHSLERTTGKVQNVFKAEFGIYGSPIVYNDNLLFASLDKHVYCIDLDTFAKKWSWNAGARIFATPMIREGRLYIGSNSGRFVELDIETGKECSSIGFTERITNPVVYNRATGRIFVTTHANEIYCLSHIDN